MKSIKCPKCGEVFAIDENSYADIAKQVRDDEFSRELAERQNDFIEKERLRTQNVLKDLENEKNIEIEKLKQELSSRDEKNRAELERSNAEKEKLISELRGKIAEKDNERTIDLIKKDNETNAQLSELKAKLNNAESDKKSAVTEAIAIKDREIAAKNEELIKVKNSKDSIIAELRSKLDNAEAEKKTAIVEITIEKEKELAQKKEELIKAENAIETEKKERELSENKIRESYSLLLDDKNKQIEQLRDMKARMSTKMVGESLEQHCETQFNMQRAVSFQNAYFEKDNDAKNGSKGDYIFRDYDNGMEYISIMFEMKNEMGSTEVKHKNEDFFKKLDKDRKEKNCEYAVLVSLLESDSELYNSGIVDVSYKYEKMYVIRPQFFIPIIAILRNVARESLSYRHSLIEERTKNVDITNFENDLNEFKESFTRSVRLAGQNFDKAMDEIDSTINHLEKVRDALRLTQKQLLQADNKAEDLTIKKLTRNNPTMKAKFAELESGSQD